VVLYYVIDSDGDTIIYNERTESPTYTEKQRVSPKQGRVVIFEGGQYHTAAQPTKGTRCIVNYNLDYYLDDYDINKVILVLILTFIFIEGLHVRYHQTQNCNTIEIVE